MVTLETEKAVDVQRGIEAGASLFSDNIRLAQLVGREFDLINIVVRQCPNAELRSEALARLEAIRSAAANVEMPSIAASCALHIAATHKCAGCGCALGECECAETARGAA